MKLGWLYGRKEIEEAISRAVKKAYDESVRAAFSALDSADNLKRLREQISQLEIDRDKKNEEFDRREREVEHKVGLERKRQEFEIQQAKRETTVGVREEALAADKQRFKDEMDFQRERLEGEVKSLRVMVEQLLKALPTAEIIATVGGKK